MAASSTAPAPSGRSYTVVKGDSLSKIAKHLYGDAQHGEDLRSQPRPDQESGPHLSGSDLHHSRRLTPARRQLMRTLRGRLYLLVFGSGRRPVGASAARRRLRLRPKPATRLRRQSHRRQPRPEPSPCSEVHFGEGDRRRQAGRVVHHTFGPKDTIYASVATIGSAQARPSQRSGPSRTVRPSRRIARPSRRLVPQSRNSTSPSRVAGRSASIRSRFGGRLNGHRQRFRSQEIAVSPPEPDVSARRCRRRRGCPPPCRS